MMTRRRADAPHPYPDLAVEEMTVAQRHEVQGVLVERYHGRKDREAWDRRYWRGRAKWPTHCTGQVYVRSRVLAAKRIA